MNTETPNETVPTPKKQAKPRKKARRAAAKPAAESKIAYPGLTVTDCAKACGKTGCVISGKSYCGHPRKGAQCDMSDPAAVERLQTARKQLAVTDADKRFT